MSCGSADSSDAVKADAGIKDAPLADAKQVSDSSVSDAPAPYDARGEKEALGPPYPIVLAHGFFGFEDFAGIGFISYFYDVKDHLKTQGEPEVFTPAVDPFNNSIARGTQLEFSVAEILKQTGHAKVNIIGHSQGGLDARVVAVNRPELVASVTTIGTPHAGTPIADVVLKLLPNPQAKSFIDIIAKLAGKALYDTTGQGTSLVKPLELFSKKGIAAFNTSFPDQATVKYFSIAGRSDWHKGGKDCQTQAPPFIAKWSSERDPIDSRLALTEEYLDGGVLAPYPNDGLVRVKDAKHGTFLGCVPADHLDQVGQLLGDKPGAFNSWRHKSFYVDLVAYLRSQGL